MEPVFSKGSSDFKQDNAPYHTAKSIQKCFKEHKKGGDSGFMFQGQTSLMHLGRTL